MLSCKKDKFNRRKAFFVENEFIKIVILPGGGHIASVSLKQNNINPLWVPPWDSIDPDKFSFKKHYDKYGADSEARLLASISGHNICFDYFGAPSKDEAAAGMTVHGEAPVLTWKVKRIKKTKINITFVYGTYLPNAGLSIERTIVLNKKENICYVREKIDNLSTLDKPVCINQHVTFGPPFLKKGVSIFDMPVKWGKTLGKFSKKQRLKLNTEFSWPFAPLSKGGKTDLRRTFKEGRSSDFSAQQFDRKLKHAWFSSYNPFYDTFIGYVFERKDFPWIGNWEENYCREAKPWNKRTLTRGMEFSTTPFPSAKREAVDLGKLKDERTFRWIGAKKSVEYKYMIFIFKTENNCGGIRDIKVKNHKLEIYLRKGKKAVLKGKDIKA